MKHTTVGSLRSVDIQSMIWNRLLLIIDGIEEGNLIPLIFNSLLKLQIYLGLDQECENHICPLFQSYSAFKMHTTTFSHCNYAYDS